MPHLFSKGTLRVEECQPLSHFPWLLYAHYWMPRLHELCMIMLLPLVLRYQLWYSGSLRSAHPQASQVAQSSVVLNHHSCQPTQNHFSQGQNPWEADLQSPGKSKTIILCSKMLSLLLSPHLLSFLSQDVPCTLVGVLWVFWYIQGGASRLNFLLFTGHPR